jgi:RimJ/RimL family protein N-acetyltransferase
VKELRATGEIEGRQDCRLRPAEPADVYQLWHLANDPDTRASSFHSEQIPLEGHIAWFRTKLESPSSVMWVCEQAGAVVGQVRFDKDTGDTGVVSISLLPEARDRGIAVRMLVETMAEATRRLGASRLEALVKKGNPASVRLFEKAGFIEGAPSVVNGCECHVFEWRSLGEV